MRDRSLWGFIRRALARRLAREPLGAAIATPMVSFSFDDVSLSGAQEGARLLAAHGAKGTFYVCGNLAQDASGAYAPWPLLRDLAAQGHEIGCHTYRHCNNALASDAALATEIAENRAALLDAGLPAPITYAYPFGDLSIRAKRALRGHFALRRAVWPGIVRAGSDLAAAPAVAIEGAEAVATAQLWLDRLAAEPGWLIFFAHDVQDDPSPWGITPANLAQILALVAGRGIEIVTVAQGAQRIGANLC